MIYTVTCNPSLDYIVSMKDFEIGKTNRTETETMFPGGKGINVSIVLNNLNMESTMLGFTAGFVGEEIERRTQEMGLKSEFVKVPRGTSRINVKLKDYEGTEINGQGPVIGDAEMDILMKQLDALTGGDVLVLAGSVAKGMKPSVYKEIMEYLAGRDILFVVDASGKTLLEVLEYRPFLIKPNNHELGELFGVKLETRDSVVPYAKLLQEKGARNVLVSLAGEGAVLAAENGEIYKLEAPKGELVNAVGAGDSMVAGFLAGWLETSDPEYAFGLGVAAGSASAFSDNLATKEEIFYLYEKIGSKKENCGL